ncbi:hypothetical protein CWI36_0367p0010 [Hamiltosporidium magnivora]|uniref:Uncharacterized protein n=1 Tax=Hamiltosporidium magnivora TaxID=148818 RepID=A0A4Q9LHC4_9MICR|nr:hypothetical protein CWI36_0367p0010 [Hamiltosporidium magnivora]
MQTYSKNNVVNSFIKNFLFQNKILMKVLLISFIFSKCIDIRLFYVDKTVEIGQSRTNSNTFDSIVASTTIFVKDENKCYEISQFEDYIKSNHLAKTINNFAVQYKAESKLTVGLFERNPGIKNFFVGKIPKKQLEVLLLLLNRSSFFLYETLSQNTFLDFLSLSKFFEIKNEKKFENFLKELILYYNKKLKDEYFKNLTIDFRTLQQEIDNWVILKSFDILLHYLDINFILYRNNLSETFEGEILDKNTFFLNVGDNVDITISPTLVHTWQTFYRSFSKQPFLNFLLKLISVNIVEVTGFQEANIFEFGLLMDLIPQKADILYVHDTLTYRILGLLCVFSFTETIRILKIKDKTLDTASMYKLFGFKKLRNLIIEVEILSNSVLDSIFEVVKGMNLESLSITCEDFLNTSKNLTVEMPKKIPCYNFSIRKYFSIGDDAFKSMIVKSYGNVLTSISVEIANFSADEILNFFSVFPNLTGLCICNNETIKGNEDLILPNFEKYKLKSLKLQKFVIGSELLNQILNASDIKFLSLVKCQIKVVPDLFQNPSSPNNSLETLDIFDSNFIPSFFYNNFVFRIKNLKRYNYSGTYMKFEMVRHNSQFDSEIFNSNTLLDISNNEISNLSNKDANNLEFNLIALYFRDCSFKRFILKDIELNLNEAFVFRSMRSIVNLTLNNVRYTEEAHSLSYILNHSTFSENLKSLCLINMDLYLNDVKSLNCLSSMENLTLNNIQKSQKGSCFTALKRLSFPKLGEINIIEDNDKDYLLYLKEEFPQEMLKFSKN